MIKIILLTLLILLFIYLFTIRENFKIVNSYKMVLNVKFKPNKNDITKIFNDLGIEIEDYVDADITTTSAGASEKETTSSGANNDADTTTSSGANNDGDGTTSSGANNDADGTTSSGANNDADGTTSSGANNDADGTTSSGANNDGDTTTSSGEGFSNYEHFSSGITVTITYKKIDEYKKGLLINKLNNSLKQNLTSIDEVDNKNNKYKIYNRKDALLGNVLTKKSCINPEQQCNLAYKPYKEAEFNTTNPKTSVNFTDKEINDMKALFNNKCRMYKYSRQSACCSTSYKDVDVSSIKDTLDDEQKTILDETIDKFKQIELKEDMNKNIESLRVCNDKDCGDGDWKTPDAYELCKLINLEDDDYKDKANVSASKLTKDCYTSFCNDDKYFTIDNNSNIDEIKTNHYYLIEAVKRDDVNHLIKYYGEYNDVNEQLKYGYGGNTIFHHAAYYDAEKCIEYLLTTKYDMTIVNKDLNTVLHIACLKGNYTALHKLLTHGANIEYKNKHGDTPLHCAVRSGSYNCVKILLDDNGFSNILVKNNYGENPLHTAVLPVRDKSKNDRMNFKIVEILIEYGSEIHNKNKHGDTILKTLSYKKKSLEREKIRTFLQKQYYLKYSNSEYGKMLNLYPEIRPFELNTKLNDNYKEFDDNVEYENLVHYPDKNISNSKLYVEKNTYAIKDKL